MERLEKLVGDGAYLGKFAQQAYKQGWIFERASRPESAKGFVPIAQRWVVERSYWLRAQYRLSVGAISSAD